MSEVTFAKSFLATIDKRPIKLAADHVSDPRKYPSQSPYILPRQTHPFPRKTVPTSTQQAKSKSVTATIKPVRSGDSITVSDLTLDSTIHDIKTQYAQQSGQPQDKIKLLLNKKPAGDLKSLKELGVEDENVELTAMIMGGASASNATTPAVEKNEPVLPTVAPADKMDIDSQASAPESEKAQVEAEVASGGGAESAAVILKTEAFWDDLQGFLTQRLRDEKEGARLAKLFRETAKR